jgi:FixJ family two-component response regulator
MPEMDGDFCCDGIQASNARYEIIKISGGGQYGDLGPLRTAKLLGSTFSLEKPFTQDELLNLAEKAFRQDSTEN